MKRICITSAILLFLTGITYTQDKISGFPVLKGQYLGQKPPRLVPEIFAPGIINTNDKNHSSITISPDGKEMYWSLFSNISGIREERIWYMRSENGIWTKPQVAPFSGEYRDGQPSFSPDGSKLFFSSLRPLDRNDRSGDANIWFVEKKDKRRSLPECLDLAVNTEYQEWFPTVAKNGNTSWDIYCSKFENGKYTLPERLSDSVNGKHNDGTPYIDPDEKFIIFFSERPEGKFEDGKLYISFRQQDGSWTSAKSMGNRINTAASRFPNITSDGRYLFFTNFKSGTEDIYWVDAKIIDDLKQDTLKQ